MTIFSLAHTIRLFIRAFSHWSISDIEEKTNKGEGRGWRDMYAARLSPPFAEIRAKVEQMSDWYVARARTNTLAENIRRRSNACIFVSRNINNSTVRAQRRGTRLLSLENRKNIIGIYAHFSIVSARPPITTAFRYTTNIITTIIVRNTKEQRIRMS